MTQKTDGIGSGENPQVKEYIICKKYYVFTDKFGIFDFNTDEERQDFITGIKTMDENINYSISKSEILRRFYEDE